MSIIHLGDQLPSHWLRPRSCPKGSADQRDASAEEKPGVPATPASCISLASFLNQRPGSSRFYSGFAASSASTASGSAPPSCSSDGMECSTSDGSSSFRSRSSSSGLAARCESVASETSREGILDGCRASTGMPNSSLPREEVKEPDSTAAVDCARRKSTRPKSSQCSPCGLFEAATELRAKLEAQPRRRTRSAQPETSRVAHRAATQKATAIANLADSPSRLQRSRSGAPPPLRAPADKTVECDKCGEDHESSKCPHFKKGRCKHADAWSHYGKSESSATSASRDRPVILQNARIVPQPGDGSCLFHSLCFGLQENITAQELRKEVSAYIAKHSGMRISGTSMKDWIKYDSGGSVSHYVNKMRGDSRSWGGGIEMAALTKMKNVNVHVYENAPQGFKRISAFETPGASKTINVVYQGRMHYDALVCK